MATSTRSATEAAAQLASCVYVVGGLASLPGFEAALREAVDADNAAAAASTAATAPPPPGANEAPDDAVARAAADAAAATPLTLVVPATAAARAEAVVRGGLRLAAAGALRARAVSRGAVERAEALSAEVDHAHLDALPAVMREQLAAQSVPDTRVVTPAELRALAMVARARWASAGGYRAAAGDEADAAAHSLDARAAALEWAPPPSDEETRYTHFFHRGRKNDRAKDFPLHAKAWEVDEKARGLRRALHALPYQCRNDLEKIRREREARVSKELDALDSERMQLMGLAPTPTGTLGRARKRLAQQFGAAASAEAPAMPAGDLERRKRWLAEEDALVRCAYQAMLGDGR